MIKRLISLLLVCTTTLFLCSCAAVDNSSTFSIDFIDVGQGDSALVQCDGHYMLIDGGDKSAGDIVYDFLEERGIQHLDILAMSHMHEDHIGGLERALSYASKIDKVIANTAYSNSDAFQKVATQLSINQSKITVPDVGAKFKLGTATVEVVDNSSEDNNDSLVLLITYKSNRFLFTGDIGETAQRRIIKKYQNEGDSEFKIDLIKMPHHGGKALYLFIRTFMPRYAVISVGAQNIYGHPYQETLELLEQAQVKCYRTDKDGNINVKSDGKDLIITTSK